LDSLSLVSCFTAAQEDFRKRKGVADFSVSLDRCFAVVLILG
jgi:hypothetical protein